jgi:fatty acid desaturase
MGATMREMEWPTLGMLGGCYLLWFGVTGLHGELGLALAVPLLMAILAQHSSLQHEVLHGHPFRRGWPNELTVFWALGLWLPYRRFRDLHLQHHRVPTLTDPHDDPESFYLPATRWRLVGPWMHALLTFNNTLLGRMLVGPALAVASFLSTEAGALARDQRGVRRAWALHLAGLVPVVAWLFWVRFPPLAYAAAAYGAVSLLMIRTYLEHQAVAEPQARTVIVERGGPLALLFLNNNLHAVHHERPSVPWYRLPAVFRAERERYLARAGDYRYRSYWDVIRRYLLVPKEPVLWPLDRQPS